MKEIDKIYESLLFSIPQNNLGTEYKYGFQHGITLFKKAIDNSTVFSDQMRKKGAWIKACGIDHTCNVCQYSYMDYVDGWEYEPSGKLPNFCPNCGADMRGGNNDDPE